MGMGVSHGGEVGGGLAVEGDPRAQLRGAVAEASRAVYFGNEAKGGGGGGVLGAVGRATQAGAKMVAPAAFQMLVVLLALMGPASVEAAQGEVNYFLIFTVVVLSILTVVVSVYLLIIFQHPDDDNQAFFPKILVVVGLSLSILFTLMLPLDVANRKACGDRLVDYYDCDVTMPMTEMWYSIYTIMFVCILIIIPFAIFYYEQDQELSTTERMGNAASWVAVTTLVMGLCVGLGWFYLGYVDYTVDELSSPLVPASEIIDGAQCYALRNGEQDDCNGQRGGRAVLWSIRASVFVFIIAIGSIGGWLLFMAFAGVGVIAMPIDLIFAFIYRPRSTISRAQYAKECLSLYMRAREIKEAGMKLRDLQKAGQVNSKWRRNRAKLKKAILVLEGDEDYLNSLYPQGEGDPWLVTQVKALGSLVLGVLSVGASASWLLHIVVYMLVQPPPSAFLNDLFIELDAAWPLLGTVTFALFAFYMMCCVILGNITVGFNLIVTTIHPMKVGGTYMSSFLFNVCLILLCSTASIQFCASAFDLFVAETDVGLIFGNQLESLRGVHYLFKNNVFVFTFFGLAMLTLIYKLLVGVPDPAVEFRKQRALDYDD